MVMMENMFKNFQKFDYYLPVNIGNRRASMNNFMNVVLPLFLFCYMGYFNSPLSSKDAFRHRVS